MKKIPYIIMCLFLAMVLIACEIATPTTPTDPVPTLVYPEGSGVDSDGGTVYPIHYVEPLIELYADKLGTFNGQEGFLYLYNEDTKEIIQLSDDTYETVCDLIGHVFFSSNGGQLTHYVEDTGERYALYTAKNGIIRAIDYFNDSNNPILYFLDGPNLIRYDLLTGETSEVGVFNDATTVVVSPANPNLLGMDGPAPFGRTILNLKTGETVHVESEGGWWTFYDDGIMPENEDVGSVDPHPGI